MHIHTIGPNDCSMEVHITVIQRYTSLGAHQGCKFNSEGKGFHDSKSDIEGAGSEDTPKDR